MKYFKFIVVAMSFATFIFACNSSSKSNNKFKYKIVSLADSSQNYTNDTLSSFSFHMKYCKVQGPQGLLVDSLKSWTAEDVAKYVKDEFNKIKDMNEMGYYHMDGSYDISPISIYQNSKVVSVAHYENWYNGDRAYTCKMYTLNYSKIDNSYISLSNLSNNLERLTKIGKKSFIEQNGELEHFEFPDQKFYLPKTFYFTDSTLVFHYGYYEIALYSYQKCGSDIVLKNSDIKDLVKYIE